MDNTSKKAEYEFTSDFSQEAKDNFLKFIQELNEEEHNCAVCNHTNHSNHNNW